MEKIIDIQQPEFSVEIDRVELDEESIVRFLNEYPVKFVVLTQSLRKYSSDKKVTNINDLKKTYKGQTYMQEPFRLEIIDNKPKMRLVDADEDADGYMIISKRSLRESTPRMMRVELAVILEEGKKLAQESVESFNALFATGQYRVKIVYMGKEYSMDYIATSIEKLKWQILSSLPFVNDKFDAKVICEFDKLIEKEKCVH